MEVGFPWISLDSLVRIQTFQRVTRDKSDKILRVGFSVMLGGAGTEAGGRGMRKRSIVMAQVYLSF